MREGRQDAKIRPDHIQDLRALIEYEFMMTCASLESFDDDPIYTEATDIAARGLNIANISHAIDYDTTAVYDDYIHRIGRAGRWNKKGKALTFIE